MMDCTFVLVADMVAGLGARVKKWRRKEMVAVVGGCWYEVLTWGSGGGTALCVCARWEEGGKGFYMR